MNLSAPSWKLLEGEASEVLGLDVNHPELFRPDRGRVYRGRNDRRSFISVSREPLSCGGTFDAEAVLSKTRSFLFSPGDVETFSITNGTYNSAAGTIAEGQPSRVQANYDYKGVGFKVLEKVDNDTIRVSTAFSPNAVTGIEALIVRSPVEGTRGSYIPSPESSEDTFITKTPMKILEDRVVIGSDVEEDGLWTSEEEDGFIFQNTDRREGIYGTFSIVERENGGQEDDSLELDSSASEAGNLNPQSKLKLISLKTIDRRGLWVSDGRYFWILTRGKWRLILDLGDDTFLGAVWRMARIANNRFLLVSPSFVPRVLHLDKPFLEDDESWTADGEETLSGCIPPKKPRMERLDARVDDSGSIIQPSWLCETDSTASTGSLTDGTELRVMVRGVNVEDDIYSDFVPVAEGNDAGHAGPPWTSSDKHQKIDANEHPSALVFAAEYADGLTPPPWHPRINAVEVWRSMSGIPSDFFHESTIEVPDLLRGEFFTGDDYRMAVHPKPLSSTIGAPIRLSDENVLGLTVLTNLEFSGGGLPPICRDVVSLGGITFCFGKASSTPERPTIYSRNFHTTAGNYDGSTKRFTAGSPASFYDKYVWEDGDELVVVFGGAESGERIPEGVYAISSPFSATTLQLDITEDPPLNSITNSSIHAYIRRPYKVIWPTLEDDEVVHFSRTDSFRPESFPYRRPNERPLTLALSRTGDTFRRAVVVGNSIAVIMQEGVHLLRIEGTSVFRDTISNRGTGTPWPDSVLVVENSVIWATRLGIRTMNVSNDVNDEGFRAKLGFLSGEELKPWFREAEDNEDTVDAGYDSRNGRLFFRRQDGAGWSQVLVISLRFQSGSRPLVSLLNGRAGIRYISASRAFSDSGDDFRLYSFLSSGDILEEDSEEGSSLPEDLTLSGVIEEDFEFRKLGENTRMDLPEDSFSSLLRGSSIIFRSGSVERMRTVVAAGTRYLEVSPELDPTPAVGDTFRFVLKDFRIKTAPVIGASRERVKTAQSISLRAYKEERDPTSSLILRSYVNHGPEIADSGSVGVFDDADVGKTSEDRVSSIGGQGTAVALEIENLDPGNDFRIESLRAELIEEGSKVADEVA
jgi:hypothetical protein